MKANVFVPLLVFSALSVASAQYFVIEDQPEFDSMIGLSSKLAKLAGDMQFVEGPVWVPAEGGYLIFSDIPANELKKWSVQGDVATFRKPSNQANGNCLDREGRLITAEQGGRRLAITQKDGAVQTLVDRYAGKRFNSPNDVVVKADGTVWFTDPDYGLGSNPKEQEGDFVFRFDPKTKDIRPVATDFERPNGLCFAPGEKRLYIADSGRSRRHIRVFDVQKDSTLTGSKVFCTIDRGVPDGIRCDDTGRLYSTAGDGIHVFGPEGGRIGKFIVPETPANLAFGGKDCKTLFITARTSLYAIRLRVRGPK
jgi:gluconolactonase